MTNPTKPDAIEPITAPSFAQVLPLDVFAHPDGATPDAALHAKPGTAAPQAASDNHDPFAGGFDRQAARDAALDALLPHVAAEGWTLDALRRHAGPDADLLFPGGASELVAAYIDCADRRMAENAAAKLDGLRLPARVRTLILNRLEDAAPHRAAIRRALALLALPGNALLAARTLACTVDSIWFAAGDRSADFSWYTKRAILASVYSTTLLFWLDERHSLEDTAAFLDRRLDGVARITRLRRRLTGQAA